VPDDTFLDEYRESAAAAARAAADLRIAEDDAKAVFSEQFLAADGGSVDRKEHVARTSPQYKAAMDKVAVLRGRQAEASADLDYRVKRWETWRTKMANYRAKLTMGVLKDE
jgi:hypothetical protein